jgi:hypothetical protein
MQTSRIKKQFAFAWHCVYDKPHHGGQHTLFLGFSSPYTLYCCVRAGSDIGDIFSSLALLLTILARR